MSNPKIKSGDRVEVPWGLDTYTGRVVEILRSGTIRRARVAVDVPGFDEPQSVTLPLDSLSPLKRGRSEWSRPGGWVHMSDYEDRLRQSLLRSVEQVPELRSRTSEVVSEAAGDTLDFSISSNGYRIFVEVKWQVRDLGSVANQIERYLSHFRMSNVSERMSALLISPNSPSGSARSSEEYPFIVTSFLVFVTWRGSVDDERLVDALAQSIKQAKPPDHA